MLPLFAITARAPSLPDELSVACGPIGGATEGPAGPVVGSSVQATLRRTRAVTRGARSQTAADTRGSTGILCMEVVPDGEVDATADADALPN
jgi:hypothetical protein